MNLNIVRSNSATNMLFCGFSRLGKWVFTSFGARLMIFAVEICHAQQPEPLEVESGLVHGTYQDGLMVYKGIPFAAPPVGELRWREWMPKGIL